MRTISTEGTRAQMSSAISTSRSVAAPKLSPSAAALFTASSTAGWAWPRIMGPQEPTKSMYSFPSASKIRSPAARAMNRGVMLTEPKARTGLFTPPGIRARALSNSSSERPISPASPDP